ncbi:MAG: hypothetical protein NT098_05620 [Candidatus Parcubacteria bacterium]|nr:hypothetical protein [Candidatus Parcubacteria bacterium]
METSPQIKRSELPIEQQANFEGSWTNLMIERLRNPEIRKQVIDLICRVEEGEKDRPIGKKTDRKGNQEEILIEDGDHEINVERYYTPRSREEIEKEYDHDVEEISQSTPISYSQTCSPFVEVEKKQGREVLTPYMNFPLIGPMTSKALGVFEAHEKGHVIRRYSYIQSRNDGLISLIPGEDSVGEMFRSSVDFSKLECHNIVEKLRIFAKEKGLSESSLPKERDIASKFRRYLMNPMELAERMGQIKNYFGMKGGDMFMKEHLAYSREHYVKDVGLDNEMTQFFQIITPEKENTFIELINSAGI